MADGLRGIRSEFELAEDFPSEVSAEAIGAATRLPEFLEDAERLDATHLPLTAIDPPGSTDLDQAFHIEPNGNGLTLHYMIADLVPFIRPNGAIDREANRRGVTVYLPASRTPLHPPTISEAAASLLPGKLTPCVWWKLDFDKFGRRTAVSVDRAIAECRRAISYAEAEALISTDPQIELLAEFGSVRQQVEKQRGGVSLELPEQEVTVSSGGRVGLTNRVSRSIEDFNAQMSLATGMAAADLMLRAETGILRTMERPDPQTIGRLQQASRALGIRWDGDPLETYPEWVRGLDPVSPKGAALMVQAARSMGSAGYVSFVKEKPESYRHSAVASAYAHVTAPLRRLVDRYGTECALAAANNRPVPGWVLDRLDDLPKVMSETTRKARQVERAVVDLVEVAILSGHIGETFEATVVSESQSKLWIQIEEPPIQTTVDRNRFQNRHGAIGSSNSGPEVGQKIRIRLESVDYNDRLGQFVRAPDDP